MADIKKIKLGTTTYNIVDAKAARTDHTHDVSIAASSGTNELTLAHGTKYAITAGGDSFVFTMPTDNNTNTDRSSLAYCSTPAGTAAKTATMPGFALSSGQYIFLRTTVKNSATSSVTLNINSTGAKPVKIGNSSTNPTASNFPAGDYLANYDGTNWILTRIYLTDTTYSLKTAASGGTDVSLVTTGEKYNWNAAKTHADSAHAPSDAEKNVQSDWNVTNTSSDAFIKNKPTIPTVNNATLTLNVGGQAVSGNNAFTANDATNTTYNVPSATASAYGVVKVSSVNSSAVTVNSESTTAGRYYPVELNSDGKAIVNVPWTDTNTDTDTHYTKYLQIKGNGTEAVKFTQNADKSLNLKPGTNVSISAASGEITISATDTTYSLVGAKDTTGLVKNGSSVTSTSGLTACPIINGIPYYKDTNTDTLPAIEDLTTL